MKTILVALLIALGTQLAVVPSLRAEIQPEQVRSAIEKAITFLKEQQNADGTWSERGAYEGGVTALCTLALLNAGVEPEDECVQKALHFLRKLPPALTYTTALQTMVLCAAEPDKDRVLIRRNVQWLQEMQLRTGAGKGGWSYPRGGRPDNSNSQFALLGLYEAHRIGVPVSDKTWRMALEYWHRWQNDDGAWGYNHMSRQGSGSMTCAGISSVVIASSVLNRGDADFVGNRVKCCVEHKPDPSVEKAVAWLEAHFAVHTNPGNGNWLLYYLYGLERAGRMTNRRFIGQHDWYREGAEMLVSTQARFDGFWKGLGGFEDEPHVATSFALLFLAKGRRPILIAKLKHLPVTDWNHHRHDLDNLTTYVENRWKRDLTWQVIDSENATVEDLLQAPVLFISGKVAPDFSEEEVKRLRDYVDRGGFIFAEACCGGDEFDKGFRALMCRVFPEREYNLRLLPPSHPIWGAEEPVDPRFVRPLWGIEHGCRTSVVYCPQDLSCYWELARMGQEEKLPKAIREEVEAVEAIGINVLAYATNRELKFKYEAFQAPAVTAAEDKFDRGKLYVARLSHPGGCSAAPAALSNLMQVAAQQLKVRASTEVRELSMTDPQIFHYHLLFMHGRQQFRLTEAERKTLRTYLERGGMLMADSICSSKDFTESFRKEMKALFPTAALARIPASHPMFSAELGGENLTTVSRRQMETRAGGAAMKMQVIQGEPYLEGITLGQRYAVLFSPYDLSCALENHQSLDCEGYIRADAARIGLSVLLYSLHQ